MPGAGEMADDRGGFGFDSDIDVDVVNTDPGEAPAPVEEVSAAADAPAPAAKPTDDGDDLDKATTLEEVKAALKKRSPTREDRAAIDARLSGMSEMERELIELRAWRKANEKPATEKPEAEKPQVDEWDELLGKGPAFIQAKAQEIAKKEVEAALKEVAAIRAELTERDTRAERARQVESREALLKEHADGHETLLKFRDLVRQYPGLEDRALAHKHPAKFAYDQVKMHERMSKYTSYEDMIRGEAARLEQEAAGAAQPAPAAPVTQLEPKRRPLTLAAHRGGTATVAAAGGDHFPNF